MVDHGDLSPSGSVSNRTRQAAQERQAVRASKNAQAHKEFEAAVRSGEVVDTETLTSRRVTKEGLESRDRKAADSALQSQLNAIDSQIRTIENLGSMSHLPNGKLKAKYQRTVDLYKARREQVLADNQALFARYAPPAGPANSDFLKEWGKNSKVVDEKGDLLKVFHGTQRLDRVGKRFLKKRASSGPMPFFTASSEISGNYATGKADVSIDEEETDYSNWFRVKTPGSRKAQPLEQAWYSLSAEERTRITKLAPRVRRSNDEGEESDINLGPETVTNGLGGYHLDRHRGNALKALVDAWLTSGALSETKKNSESPKTRWRDERS